jgi:transcriptional regulator with XRE-family HTH domain
MVIAPEQIRAARALLRLGQADLAERARLTIVTIRRLESGGGGGRVAPSTVAEVRLVPE